MTNRFMMSVAAAALIAGTGFANAQGGMGRESPSGGTATEQKSDMKSQQSEQKSMGAEKSQRTEDQKGGQDMKAEGREGRQDKNMKAEGKEDRGGSKAEQKGQTTGQGTMQRDQSTTQGRDQTTPQSRDQKAQGQQDRTQTQGGAAGTSQTTTTGQAGAGAKLSAEQRTQITSVIKEQRVQPATNVNFAISVGTRVPRDVTFYTLPERVVTIYPEWRSYKYILVKEQIVIVDPNTYEIVAVLEA